MNTKRLSDTLAVRAGLGAGALALVAFSLACRLCTAPQAAPASGTSVANLLLVGSQSALADSLFREADVYFHRGVEIFAPPGGSASLLGRLQTEISPRVHVHAEGQDVKEIMPWLRLATEINPHDVTAYRVAAFWVSDGLRNPRAAEGILREAWKNNPEDYRIQIEICKLYLHQRRLDDAQRAAELAFRLWPKPLAPEADEARLDRGEILQYRALLFEAAGRKDDAMRTFQEIRRLLPDRYEVTRQMEVLAGSADPRPLALRLLDGLSRAHEHVYTGNAAPHEEPDHDGD